MSIFIHRRLLLFLCFMGLTAVLVTAVGAQPAPPPIFERAELPYLPSDQPAPQNPATDPLLNNDWSGFWVATAWQEYVDGNWEIFMPYRRLTSHAASDIYPNVDPTGQIIAFSSNRNGNGYEIHLVGRDGSGQDAITNNTADDVRPAWSPNGNQIAFQSYRDGRAEVYVMNPDGSGQTRLTHSPGSGLPSWSPDGKQILFTSIAQNGISYVHIMDKNGRNMRQLAAQPSSYAMWAPDGSAIVYSADWDGDGWLDLMIMNPDGSDQRPLYDAPPLTDVWPSSWGPDSESVYFTKIFYIYYQGNWYWTEAEIGYFDLASGAAIETYTGLRWNFILRAFDSTAPTVSFGQLHTYSSAGDIVLSWSGEDFHKPDYNPAGIKSYDLQYRTSLQAPWQDWLMETSEERSTYAAVPGQTTYFRVRAIDRAANLSDWAHTSTTFYSRFAQGQLMDNRGTPLQQVPFSVSPVPINQAQTDNEGNIGLYMQQASSHLLHIVREGYGDFVETAVRLPILGQLYLPPADNVIVNGEFEATNPLNNWQVGGNLAVTAVDNSYTGQQAILLNNTNCTTSCAETITDLAFPNYYSMSTATDSNGKLHLLHSSSGEYIFQTDDGWSEPQPLPDGYTNGGASLFFVDESLHLLWAIRTGYEKRWWYSTKPADGEWSEPSLFLDNIPSVVSVGILHVGVNYQGRFYVLVEYNKEGLTYQVYYQQDANGRWKDGILFREPSAFMPNTNLKLLVLPDNTVLIVEYDSRENIIIWALMSDGRWSKIKEFFNLEFKQVLVDSDGTVHLFVEDDDDEWYHITKPLGANWTFPYAIKENLNISANLTYKNVALDIDNNLHFLVSARYSTNNYNLYYLTWHKQTGWQKEILPSMDTSVAFVYLDHYNNKYIFFNDSTLYSYPSTVAGTAVISQTVTIPANMVAPTLSFMTHQVGSPALTVWVDDGTTATAVPLSSRGAAKWHQAWADLTPWVGQTVTLAFELNQEVGDPLSQIMLDSISLGSAYPDSWVRATSTLDTQPGETVQLQADYGNSSGLDSNGAVLHVTLPDDLSFVSASTPPTSQVDGQLSWQIGDLPAHTAVTSLVITATIATDMAGAVTVPIALQTAVAERETANNQAQTTVRIRYYQYLPLLLRP